VKAENSSMVWATNRYLVNWHCSLRENCGNSVLLPASCQPFVCTGARPSRAGGNLHREPSASSCALRWPGISASLWQHDCKLHSPPPQHIPRAVWKLPFPLHPWEKLASRRRRKTSQYLLKKKGPAPQHFNDICFAMCHVLFWLMVKERNCLRCQVEDWITEF